MANKEAREAVYRQVGIETASASRRTKESQIKPLTVDTPTGVAKQIELGSPMTKMGRVMMSQEATSGVSGEPSQTEQKGELINLTNSSDEEMVDNAMKVHPVKVKTEELDDDDVFTGLTDHDKDEGDDDDDVFPGPIELPDSDLVMRKIVIWTRLKCNCTYIYDQQQKNRNTGEVSEIMLMQMKTEIEETKDMGDQGTHQTSLETEKSFTPLSSGDTEEQLTIPFGEDTEASMVQQSEEVQGKESDGLQQAEETAVVMMKVKALERPKVGRQEVQLYQPPTGRQRGRSGSPTVDVPMKPMGKELSKLAVMKPVQEYKQRFLDHAQEEGHHLLTYENVLEESWEKTKTDNQVAQQGTEREEAQHISQQKEEEAKKEVERIEAQLKPFAETREKCYAQRKEAGKPPLLPKIPDDEWKKIVEQWPCGPRR